MSSNQNSPVILVAEDEAIMRKVLARRLVNNGYKVLEAASGEEALRQVKFSDGAISLALIDIALPDADGADIFSRISQEHPQIKVLFMSGYSKELAVQRNLIGENDSFIEKSEIFANLIPRINDLIKS